MKKLKAQFTLLKKQDRLTFGKSKMQQAPISDSTIIIATTVTFISTPR